MFDTINGINRPSVEERAAELIQKHTEEAADIEAACEALKDNAGHTRPEDFQQIIDDAAQKLVSMREVASSNFEGLATSKLQAEIELRRFKEERGIARPPRRPDPFATATTLMTFGVTEGLMTSTLMVADGNMGVVEGVTYGLSVSTLNMVTGLTNGYHIARYLNYKKHAPYQDGHARMTRRVSACAFSGMVAVQGLLNFGAARVRATGHHHGIFDGSEVGIFATFNDFFAIAIMALGAIGGLIATVKGFKGLEDEEPGYSEVARAASGEIDDAASFMADEFCDQAEDVNLDAADSADEFVDERLAVDAQVRELKRRIRQYNAGIERSKNDMRLAYEEEARIRARVKGGPIDLPVRNFDAFDRLRLSESIVPQSEASFRRSDIPSKSKLLSSVQKEYSNTLMAIRNAYASYRSTNLGNHLNS
ncbi:MAG: hypothetical protein AAGH38_01375 [Pseudomonadota bacterium]